MINVIMFVALLFSSGLKITTPEYVQPDSRYTITIETEQYSNVHIEWNDLDVLDYENTNGYCSVIYNKHYADCTLQGKMYLTFTHAGNITVTDGTVKANIKGIRTYYLPLVVKESE